MAVFHRKTVYDNDDYRTQNATRKSGQNGSDWGEEVRVMEGRAAAQIGSGHPKGKPERFDGEASRLWEESSPRPGADFMVWQSSHSVKVTPVFPFRCLAT